MAVCSLTRPRPLRPPSLLCRGVGGGRALPAKQTGAKGPLIDRYMPSTADTLPVC